MTGHIIRLPVAAFHWKHAFQVYGCALLTVRFFAHRLLTSSVPVGVLWACVWLVTLLLTADSTTHG